MLQKVFHVWIQWARKFGEEPVYTLLSECIQHIRKVCLSKPC